MQSIYRLVVFDGQNKDERPLIVFDVCSKGRFESTRGRYFKLIKTIHSYMDDILKQIQKGMDDEHFLKRRIQLCLNSLPIIMLDSSQKISPFVAPTDYQYLFDLSFLNYNLI